MAETLLETPLKPTHQTHAEANYEEANRLAPDELVDLSQRAVHLVMMHAKQRYGLHNLAFESGNLRSLKLSELESLAQTTPQVLALTERWLHGQTQLDAPRRDAQSKIEMVIAGSLNDIILDKTRHEVGRLKHKRSAGEVNDEDFRQLKQKFDRRIDHSLDFVVASNHQLRSLAIDYGYERHEVRQIIYALSPKDKHTEARHLEEGIAAEVAVFHGLQHLVSELDESDDGISRSVKFGEVDDDIKGGDIVYTSGGKRFYIDVKAYNPDEQDIDPDKYGLKFERPMRHGDNYEYKAIVRFPRPELIEENYSVKGSAFYRTLTETIDRLEQGDID